MTSYDTRLYIPKLPWNDYKDQIKKLIIKPGITFISEYAFFQCHFLTSATIANSVTEMGEAAFSGCIRLSDLALSTNLTSIPNYCLAACHALKAITIPDKVSFIGSDAFNDCTSLVSVRLPYNLKNLGAQSFLGCSELLEIDIPAGVETIGGRAFQNCGKLKYVKVGPHVKNIGGDAFFSCFNLQEVYISDMNAWLDVDFENIYSNPLSFAHYLYLNNKIVQTLLIPFDRRSIKNHTYYGGYFSSIIIPKDISSIGNSNFAYNEILKDVYCYATNIPVVGDFVFNQTAIANATLHVPEFAIEAYKTTEPWCNFGTIIPLTDSDPHPTGMTVVKDEGWDGNILYYTLDGKRTNHLQQGVTIVRMSDGTTKKVVER